MKKYITLLLVFFLLVFALCSCSEQAAKTESSSVQSNASQSSISSASTKSTTEVSSNTAKAPISQDNEPEDSDGSFASSVQSSEPSGVSAASGYEPHEAPGVPIE